MDLFPKYFHKHVSWENLTTKWPRINTFIYYDRNNCRVSQKSHYQDLEGYNEKTDFGVQTGLKRPKLSQFQRVHIVQNYGLPTLTSIFACSFLGHPVYSREHHRENNTKVYTYDEWKTNDKIRNDGSHQLKGVSTVIKSKCWKNIWCLFKDSGILNLKIDLHLILWLD